MAYLIGTDEAGYGPNLGPLVIGGTLWRVPDDVDGAQLYDRLPGVVMPGESRGRGLGHCKNEPPLRIGDSKALYSRSGGLAGLERGVFSALASTAAGEATVVPATWRSLLTVCDPDCGRWIDSIPWYAGYEQAVPIDVGSDLLVSGQRLFAAALSTGDVELLSYRARVVFPQEFNKRVTETGSKGTALSLWTLELVDRLLQSVSEGSVLVQSDKHGGRNRYAALLQHVFPDHFIEVGEETRQQSTYRWGPPSRRIAAQFIAKGERFLPAALSSMLAKYLRELSMGAFNGFWKKQVPELRPTAGYPVDAKRFRAEIQEQQQKLGIDDDVLWRQR